MIIIIISRRSIIIIIIIILHDYVKIINEVRVKEKPKNKQIPPKKCPHMKQYF